MPDQTVTTGDAEQTYTKTQVEEIVENRVSRLLEKQAKEQKSAADKAAQDTLAAEAKWKELAETHAGEVDRLKPFEAQAQEYAAYLDAQLKDRVKGLGDVAKKAYKALPESMSTSDRLKYLQESGLLQADENQIVLGTPLGKKKTPRKKGGRPEDYKPTRM